MNNNWHFKFLVRTSTALKSNCDGVDLGVDLPVRPGCASQVSCDSSSSGRLESGDFSAAAIPGVSGHAGSACIRDSWEKSSEVLVKSVP
jgi:hypothetical protein